MGSKKHIVIKGLWAIGLCQLVLVPTMTVQAESPRSRSTEGKSSEVLVSELFAPPDGGSGQPNTTAGGASRGDSISPIALRPKTQAELTATDRPTFLVYIPETAVSQAVFILTDENEDYYYQTSLPIEQTGGIISIKLPEEAPEMLVGKQYYWSAILMGEDGIKPDSPGVKGTIKRVTRVQTPADETWYDAVGSLAKMRRDRPSDRTVAEKWTSLLRSEGLEAIARQPILE